MERLGGFEKWHVVHDVLCVYNGFEEGYEQDVLYVCNGFVRACLCVCVCVYLLNCTCVCVCRGCACCAIYSL